MDDTNRDARKNLEDMIRQIIEQSMAGTIDHPGAFGFKIVISGAGIPSGLGTAGFPPSDASEIPVEVFTLGGEVVAVTELPGLNPDQISISFEGDTLFIRGSDGTHSYEASTKLPPVEHESFRASMKHGVLEVTFASPWTAGPDTTLDAQPGD